MTLYKTPPIIIPVFLPHLGCKARCLFCNQKPSEEGFLPPSSVRNLIETALIQIPQAKKNRAKQVAFYGGSFTAIPREDQSRYLEALEPFLSCGRIDSIRISTRPDALDEETLTLLKKYGVKTIEIGVQSMMDEVLSLAHRGHDAKDTAETVYRLKRLNFEVGLQLMLGLPGDTCDRFLQTLDRVIELNPDFIRIHPTLVLKGAPLENLWREGSYSPLSLEETVDWLKKGLLKLEKASVPVVRIGLQTTAELERDYLAGPFHPALHQMVDSAIFLDMAEYLLRSNPLPSRVVFSCNVKEVSTLRGQRNGNILKLKKDFNLGEVLIDSQEEWPQGILGLQTPEGNVSIHRKTMSF